MLEKIKEFFAFLLDIFLPLRSDFQIVKNLSQEDIHNLPKADKILDESWITSLFQYKNRKVKAIVWELKYRENTLPLETIGKMIFEEILFEIGDLLLFNQNAEFILLPIPMTDNSKAERGYNQSELICRSIIENDNERRLLYAPQWFLKVKETPKQSKSGSKEERIKNLAGSFRADERISGRYVFLVDDVVTTGSTLKEARETLLLARALDVFAFTIAH